MPIKKFVDCIVGAREVASIPCMVVIIKVLRTESRTAEPAAAIVLLEDVVTTKGRSKNCGGRET